MGGLGPRGAMIFNRLTAGRPPVLVTMVDAPLAWVHRGCLRFAAVSEIDPDRKGHDVPGVCVLRAADYASILT